MQQVVEVTHSLKRRRDDVTRRAPAFRGDVQGLRALAVALVIAAHAKTPHFAAGIVGVDVFFVISGFVITGVLLRMTTGTIRERLITFYGRRVRRIIPAATLVMVATLWATYHYLGGVTGRTLGIDERWASLFTANFHFAFTGENYFASQQPPSLILHYWSLSVEEQFYFVYPLLVFVVFAVASQRSRHRVLVGVLFAIITVSSIWCIYQTRVDPIFAYYSPFTRIWELGLGALVATARIQLPCRSRAFTAAVGWAALASILASAYFLSTNNYPGGAVWWPVGSTALLIWVGKSPSGIGPERLLSLRPLVFLGDISYSIYLWHYPLLMIPMQYSLSSSISVEARVEAIAASIGLAILTYYAVENPIRRWKWLSDRRWLTFASAGALIASVWLVSVVLEHLYAV